MLVDNRAGASGTIGSSFVAKAPADGYTLLLAPNTFAMAQLVLKLGAGHGYDVLNGFTPVIEVGSTSLFLVAGPGAGVRSFKEAISSSQGRSLGYATPGNGSPMPLPRRDGPARHGRPLRGHTLQGRGPGRH